MYLRAQVQRKNPKYYAFLDCIGTWTIRSILEPNIDTLGNLDQYLSQVLIVASVYLLSSPCNFNSSTPRPCPSTPRLSPRCTWTWTQGTWTESAVYLSWTRGTWAESANKTSPAVVLILYYSCLKVANAVTKVILKLFHIDMGHGKGGYWGCPGILRLKLSNAMGQ